MRTITRQSRLLQTNISEKTPRRALYSNHDHHTYIPVLKSIHSSIVLDAWGGRSRCGVYAAPPRRLPILVTWHKVLSWIQSTASPPNPSNNFTDWWAVFRLPQPWRALLGFECYYLDVIVFVCSSLGMYKAYANFHYLSMHQDANFLCSLEREELEDQGWAPTFQH